MPLSIEEARSLARTHRSRWLSGERPSIEAVLAAQGAAGAADDLLLRLVLAEVTARLSLGDAPSAAEYTQRFPDRQKKIEKLLADKQAELDKLRRATHETEPLWRNESQCSSPARTEGAAAAGPELASASSSNSVARPAKRLGRYELLALLGRGGFGAVHRAYDPQLDREVALKVPRAGTVDDAEQLQRFLREARAAGGLRHPHIVPIYEAGQADEQAYISSGLIVGQTMHAWLKERGRKLPPQEAAGVIAKLARALAYAHEQGVVHRDVKPHNVMIDAQGEPVLMDFGLARRDTGESQHTMEGTRMGTPAYMSPEQAGGQSHLADGRSDQWSLGVMLYELLAGQLPFQQEGLAIFLSICKDEPASLRSLDPTLPRDLQTIVQTCLNKSPADRYADCDALADDLERFLRGDAVTVRPQRWTERYVRWAKRNPAIATLSSITVLLVIAITLGMAVFSIHVQRQNLTLDRQKIEITNALAVAQEKRVATQLAVSREQDAVEKQNQTVREIEQALQDLETEESLRTAADRSRQLAEMQRKEAESAAGDLQGKTQEAQLKLKEDADRIAAIELESRELAAKSRQLANVRQIKYIVVRIREKNLAAARKMLADIPDDERVWDWHLLNAVAQEKTDVAWFSLENANWTHFSGNGGQSWRFDDSESFVALINHQKRTLTIHDLARHGTIAASLVFRDAESRTNHHLTSFISWDNNLISMLSSERNRHAVITLDVTSLRHRVYEIPNAFVPNGGATYLYLRTGDEFLWPTIPHEGRAVKFCYAKDSLSVLKLNDQPMSLRAARVTFSHDGEVACVEDSNRNSFLFDFNGNNASRKIAWSETKLVGIVAPNSIRSTNSSQPMERLGQLHSFSPKVADGKTFYVARWGSRIAICNGVTGDPVTDVQPHLGWLAAQGIADLTPDGSRCLRSGGAVCDPYSAMVLFGLGGLGEPFGHGGTLSPKGRWLFSQPAGKKIRDYDSSQEMPSPILISMPKATYKVGPVIVPLPEDPKPATEPSTDPTPPMEAPPVVAIDDEWPQATKDRRLAQWVLEMRGAVTIQQDGKQIRVEKSDELPRADFELIAIDLTSNRWVNDANAGVLKAAKNLQSLVLGHTEVSDWGLTWLGELTHLETVNLAHTKITGKTVGNMRPLLRLKSVSLDGVRVGDESLKGLENARELEFLTIARAGLTDASAPLLAKFSNLTGLVVTDCRFTLEGLQSLESLQKLQRLVLSSTAFTNDHIQALAKLRSVRELTISNLSVSANLLDPLEALSELESLDLSNARFDVNAAPSLGKLKTLKTLSLFDSNVRDTDLVHVSVLPMLNQLDLRETRVGDKGVLALAKLSALRKLNLGPAVSKTGFNALRQKLPNCEITWKGAVTPPANDVTSPE